MRNIGRRRFVTASLGVAAAVATSRSKILGASDKVTVGIVGLGNRGSWWIRNLAQRDDVTIAYLSDTNAARFERAASLIDDAGREPAKAVQDFRKILDDPAVDAVLVATNHHWHGLTTILACQARKDVYVEKPGCHNVWEGRKMVEAARKYDRVVQVGMQNRSAPYLREARDYIRSGKLGDVYLMRVLNMNKGRARPREEEGPAPSTVDWDMWCGPGPVTGYSPGGWHINRFDYSVGYSADDAVHQIDVLRFLTDVDVPKTAVSGGGVRHFKDGRDIPDTQVATLEYPDKTMVFQSTLWANYIKETPSVIREGDQFPDWLFNGTKCEIFGSDGMMLAGRHGGGYQAFDDDGKLVAQSYGRRYAAEHMDNFLECVRTREKPNGEIEEALKSTLVAHLGNVSYRVGGRMLRYDHATGWILDDDEANQYMQRKGRAPWVIPEEV